MPRGPGPNQREALRLLAQFGHWNKRAGWNYGGPSRTAQIMNSLVWRGLVRCEKIIDPIGTSEIRHYTLVSHDNRTHSIHARGNSGDDGQA